MFNLTKDYAISIGGVNVSSHSAIRQWLESTKINGMALGLENTFSILSSLNIDLSNTQIIHVAGSNGKGTLCSLMAACMSLNNDSNVLFSSPHLCRVEERIRINGKPTSKEEFDQAIEVVRISSEKKSINLTFFETTFLAAMVITSIVKPRFLILETGLGGRLDATRCAPADLAILTTITKEHTDVLGNDIYQIIREKAAIARPGKPLIAREMRIPNFQNTVIDCAANCANIELDEKPENVDCKFIQIDDNYTILQEAELLAREAFAILKIDPAKLPEAKNVVNWPARLQELDLPSGHRIILDAAHNPSGLIRVSNELIEMVKSKNIQDKLTLVFGTSPQQELEKMLSLINDFCRNFSNVEIYLTKPQGGRYPGIEPKDLATFDWIDCSIQIVDEVTIVIDNILARKPADVGTILSIGSLYLQGNILNHLGKNSDDDLHLLPKQ